MGIEYNAATDSFRTDSGATFNGFTGETSAGSQPTEINAYTAFETPGDILSTVKSPQGSPVTGREVRSSDTIEAFGQRMTVAMALQMGFLTKEPSGLFAATDLGHAGAKQEEAFKGKIELASGGTAEEAAASGFMADEGTEELLGAIIERVMPDTQIAAIDSVLRNEGNVDQAIIDRIASQMGIEPEVARQAVNASVAGMENAVYQHIEPLGVYDRDAFARFVHSTPENRALMISAARDLMMSNSTKGFEALAERFTESADVADRESVEDALDNAGIPYRRNGKQGLILDLTSRGIGQVPFKQAVKLGLIALKPNR